MGVESATLLLTEALYFMMWNLHFVSLRVW